MIGHPQKPIGLFFGKIQMRLIVKLAAAGIFAKYLMPSQNGEFFSAVLAARYVHSGQTSVERVRTQVLNSDFTFRAY